MKSFALGAMRLIAVFVGALVTAAVTVPVPVAIAGLAPSALDIGKDALSLSVASDDGAELTTEPLKPSDTAPTCAKPGTAARLWPVGSTPYGRSYNEWTQDWWGWALSQPPAINPIVDETGDSCSYGQHGPVWFLAGNFGGTTTRSCSIGCNKAIFIPIINCEWENAWVDQPILSLPDLRALCAAAGAPMTATLEVDGRALPDVRKNRVASDIFSYAMGPDNLGGQPQGVYFPAISDGIWAMLDPLPPGPHTVHFTTTNAGGFFLDVTYNLNVVALQLPCSSPPCL